MLRNSLANIKRTSFWYYFLYIFFLPLFNFIWKNFINIYGRILYFTWFSKKREKFVLNENFYLQIKNNQEFITLAKSIKEFFTKNKIDEILDNKERYRKNNTKRSSDLTNFKFNINDELPKNLKEKILKFAISEKNFSTAANYFGIIPTISLISLHVNTPVKNQKERGSMLWHKDDFGFKCLDLFLTIDQLDDSNGPFYYLKNGSKLGSLSKIENVIKNPRYGERNKVEISEFNKIYDNSEIGKFVGKSGDAIFIDSCSTYHRGGYCESNNRLMLRITYQTKDNIRKSVLNDEFLKGDEFKNIDKDIYYKYSLDSKSNFLLEFFNFQKKLLSLLRLVHFKINPKKN